VSIPPRTIDDCSRIFPVAAGNDNPLLWNHTVEGSVDMVTHTPNVPVTGPNLVGVLGDYFERELFILPRGYFQAE